MLMAEHKVPQDVEADDKLIGPFSFRQFVYLMVAFGGCALAFFMATKLSPILAIVPAPVVIFFAALALPLRKDQPMETYMAALVRYYLLKSHTRVWKADGEGSLIEISNPTIDESPVTKGLAGDEVSRRLSFLANISDTQGWSTRGLNGPLSNTNLNDEFADDAANVPDMLSDNSVADSFNRMLDKSERDIRQAAIDKMNTAAMAQPAVPTQQVQYAQNFSYGNGSISAPVPIATPPLAPAVTPPSAPTVVLPPAPTLPEPNLQMTQQLPIYDMNAYQMQQPNYVPVSPADQNRTTVTNPVEPAIINNSANDSFTPAGTAGRVSDGIIDIKLH